MNVFQNKMSRRSFVTTVSVAGLTALGTATTARADAPEQPVEWGASCDVLVIGMGGAGAAAAISAADAGAQVLLVEKAPEYLEGGNTRYSEQVMCMWENEQDGIDFMRAMADGHRDMTDEVIEFMARETLGNFDWVEQHSGGAKLVARGMRFNSPEEFAGMFGETAFADISNSNWTAQQSDGTWPYEEYPVWPNGELNDYRYCHSYVIEGEPNHKAYWEFLRRTVEGYTDSIACWFNSPAEKLIRDADTGAVIGAEVNHDGAPTNVYARNGVVLACGSYEADVNKLETLAQRVGHTYVGTSYNTGDGIAMAGALGAQMWHMAALSGPYISALQPGSERIWWPCTSAIRATANGHSIYVTREGKRFMQECGYNHHGHVAVGDTWQNQQLPQAFWAIMDADGLNSCFSRKVADPEQFVEAATVEELAGALGMDPETLAQTVTDYNSYCDKGHDDEFNRYPETLEKIENGPFYGIEFHGAFVNCQGGPKRNTRCEVVDWDDKPIAHLYSAGELGSMWGGVYIAGGNVAETCYSGRVAGANAAAPKDDVPVLDIDLPAVNEITAYDKDALCAAVSTAANEYAGAALGIHGPVVVTVSLDGDKMTAVEVVSQFETPQITRDLWTAMPQRMVEANSVDVDGVSGATIASRALRDAVTDALVRAGVASEGEKVIDDMSEAMAASTGKE